MHTALLMIDVQESFRHRPYWAELPEGELAGFLRHCRTLTEGAQARGIPIVRVYHTEPGAPDSPFAPASGLIRPLQGLAPYDAAMTVDKQRHSALAGTGLSIALRQRGIGRLIVAGIRTEQCCETTTRHASDEGFEVDFVTDATLTFAMRTPSGGRLEAAQIRERTATVLSGRFATLCTPDAALARAH